MNFALLCVWLLAVTGAYAEVKVENGAFQNVLVSFTPSIKSEDGKALLDSVQSILEEASLVLRKAIGFKIGSVTFEIPRTWDTSEWENITVGVAPKVDASSSPDILIDNITDSAFGKFPSTLQYGGCGVPGHRINVPKDFLHASSAYPKGKLLAREWIKYRYGVFDENGFPGDDMYPAYYNVAGQPGVARITSCTNQEVQYIFTDVEGGNCTLNEDTGLPLNDECEIYPLEETESVKSSLMYFQEHLPEIEHICGLGIHKHDNTAPNKHNVLCQGNSISTILLTSTDYRAQMNEEEVEVENGISFSYVQEENPRVFVAWESTSQLKAMGELIFTSIKRFLYDLPDGSQYALYSYKDGEPTELEALRMVNKWPDRSQGVFSDFTTPVDGCSSCAINKALEVLFPSNEENPSSTGFAVIIAASNPEENEDILRRLKDSQICLIVIGGGKATEEGFQNYIDASSCGSYWPIPSGEENEVIFESMFTAMESTLPKMIDDSITKTVLTQYLKFDNSLTIPVDSETGIVSLWFAKYVDQANIKCMQDDIEIPLSTLVKSADISATQFTPPKVTQVMCFYLYESSDPVLTQVRASTKPGEHFDMNAWTEDTTAATDKSSKQQMPVILYFHLQVGSYPVRGASVTAVVTTPDGAEETIELYDDGRGDPDVTADDGVYSRYFIGFNMEGEYAVSITAKDNGQATLGKNGRDRCCGSKIVSEGVQLGPFEKQFKTSFTAISGRPTTGGYKPSRIADLRVSKVDLPTVELKWTAPGGEADSGAATRYEFSLFCDQDACKDGTLPQWIMLRGNPTPKEYGSRQAVEVVFMQEAPQNGTFILSLKSVNEFEVKSEASNFVHIVLHRDLEEIVTTGDPETEKPKLQSGPEGDIIIASVIFVVLILALIGVIVYNFVLKTKQNDSDDHDKENVPPPEQNTDSRGFHATDQSGKRDLLRRAESFPVILYTHDQIKDLKKKKKQPPLYDGVASKQWISLDMLPRTKANKTQTGSETASLGSNSTISIKESVEATSEMKELDNISQKSAQISGKLAKF